MRRTVVFPLVATLFVPLGCAASQLRNTGDAMVRIEKATAGVVEDVDAFAESEKQRCIAKDLQTKEARAECIGPALGAVTVTEAATQALRAALITFWELYPLLEAKLARGERISLEDLGPLLEAAGRVQAEYKKLLPVIEEVRDLSFFDDEVQRMVVAQKRLGGI